MFCGMSTMNDQAFIFIHIQKTGGDSIRRALGLPMADPYKHYTARERRELDSELWKRAFKFAFVRNPWDRLVLWWSAISARREVFLRGARLNVFQTYILENAIDFSSFLRCDREIKYHGTRSVSVYKNQVEYIAKDMDFVGRFERLEDDFRRVASALRVRAGLPHVNASQHQHYRHYYDDELRRLVARKYERDIAAFGYVF